MFVSLLFLSHFYFFLFHCLLVLCENKIAQLELGSKDGVISMAEFRIRTEVQKTVDKNWNDRMENEDKVTTGKIESLHSIVNRLEQKVATLKGKHSISAASTVATSSGSGGSHVGAGIPGGPTVDTRDGECGAGFVKLALLFRRPGIWCAKLRRLLQLSITISSIGN